MGVRTSTRLPSESACLRLGKQEALQPRRMYLDHDPELANPLWQKRRDERHPQEARRPNPERHSPLLRRIRHSNHQ